MSPVCPEPGLPPRPESTSRFSKAIAAWMGRFIALVVIVAILYGGLLLAARTEGFRSLVAQRWEKQCGIPVHISSSSLTPAFELRLRGITTVEKPSASKPATDEEAPKPRLQVKEVRLKWSLSKFRFTRVLLQGARVDFVPDAGGGWSPTPFARWAREADALTGWKWSPPAPGSSSESEVPMPRGNEIELRIEDLDMFWHASADGPAASVEQISLSMTPLHPPGRTLTHVRLGAKACRGADGVASGPFEAEWILFDGGCVRLDKTLK